MAHPAANQLVTVQQILNAGWTSATGGLSVSTQDGGYAYLNIATSAQNVVKSSAGILGGIAVNSTLVSAVRGYDNTVSGGNVLFTIPAATAATSIFYRVRFNNGLVISSGAAADNVTVIYN